MASWAAPSWRGWCAGSAGCSRCRRAPRPETLRRATGAAGLAGVLAARLLVESLDYDGNGRLSAAELGQDRVAFGAAHGTGAGRPLDGAQTAPGLEALRSLLSGLNLLR